MTLPTQTKILRVLQSGTFERVGGNQPVQVDVRVIAATNKPLEQAVARKEFREDLFYRLNVVRVQIPPLRERRKDIPLLVNYFLRKFSGKSPRSISGEALTFLQQYHWPGNVRELENIIRRALVVAKGDAILPSDFPPEILHSGRAPAPRPEGPITPHGSTPHSALNTPHSSEAPSADSDPSGRTGGGQDIGSLARLLFQWARENAKLKVLPAVERELVIRALMETDGNQVQAAKLLGITRATLRKRIEKFNIKQELAVK